MLEHQENDPYCSGNPGSHEIGTGRRLFKGRDTFGTTPSILEERREGAEI
jgi:hypothetical protein